VLAEDAALRASTSWRLTAPLRAIRYLLRGQAALVLREMGMAPSRIERLKRVGSADGSAAKRAARIAFYTLSRAAARAPGAARLSAGMERVAAGPWNWLKARYEAYLAAARTLDGHPPSPVLMAERGAVPFNQLLAREQPVVALSTSCEDAMSPEERYRVWIDQRRTTTDLLAPEKLSGPTISILIAVTPDSAARLPITLRSLKQQTCNDWQVILSVVSDADLDGQSNMLDSIGRAAQVEDDRIRVIAEATMHTGGALRAAVEVATGSFSMVLEPGDGLHADAVAAFAKRLGADPAIDILYADEDVMEGEERRRPQFKPEWSPELLTAYNYFGRPTAIRRTLIVDAGSFDPNLDSAFEWDLNLRLVQHLLSAATTEQVRRLPMVLCHRHPLSSTGRPAPDDPAAAAYRLVLSRHWERRGLKACVITQPEGTQYATWDVVDPPLVSIIIPNKDQAALLRECLDGLMCKTSYRRIEIIIVDNGSTQADAFTLYREVEKLGVRIVFFDQPFNYSHACNLGASVSKGELILFLNNDVEIISPGWLDEMVRYALLPGVGITGAKLLYPDGRIQHAGVAIGLFMLCGHVFRMAPEHQWGIFGSPSVTRNWLAVTGACLLIRRTAYDRVGGFDESFTIAYSDIKLALDVWRAGYRVVYNPAAVLTHREGASRGSNTPEADKQRIAVSMRSLGITEDPYFHPCLASLSFIPTLSLDGEPSAGATTVKGTIKRLVGDAFSENGLDLFDDGAIVGRCKQALHKLMGDADGPETPANASSAARLIVHLLRRRSDLRSCFPRALSDGPDGGFARWLKAEAVPRYGLTSEFVTAVDAAFAADFAARARQVALYDDALRAREPLFLLPPGRPALLESLSAAVSEGALSRESAWWLLLEAAEDPGRELVFTWLFTPDWQQRFPDGITIFGRDRFSDWIRQSFGLSAPWLVPSTWPLPLTAVEQIRIGYRENAQWKRSFPHALTDFEAAVSLLQFLGRPEADASPTARQWFAELDAESEAQALMKRGVNVIGHFSYPSGLRTSAQSIINGLQLNGVETALRDVRVSLATDEPVHHKFADLELFGKTIIHVQPEPFFNMIAARSGLYERSPRPYRIGYWYWEFDSIPASWDLAVAGCDELWVATEFVARGLRARYSLPVHVMFPGLELPQFQRLPRSYFRLEEGPFVFLFTFHMTSVAERKNPWGLIAAFRRAFSLSDNVLLVIKTSFGERFPDELAKLNAAAQGGCVQIINAVHTQEETLSLMACADVYVSLHRSEGLGLTIAEAMLLKKPAIATGYSGNMDFMNEANSLLVDYRIVELGREYPPYTADLHWAEPSVDHAAALMRRLYEDRNFAADLGARGAADLRNRLNYSQAGKKMADRLVEIERVMNPDRVF
jgi:GT2 family glycosyltransferase/glycosyltransferase involved in cell wall biosynthesis